MVEDYIDHLGFDQKGKVRLSKVVRKTKKEEEEDEKIVKVQKRKTIAKKDKPVQKEKSCDDILLRDLLKGGMKRRRANPTRKSITQLDRDEGKTFLFMNSPPMSPVNPPPSHWETLLQSSSQPTGQSEDEEAEPTEPPVQLEEEEASQAPESPVHQEAEEADVAREPPLQQEAEEADLAPQPPFQHEAEEAALPHSSRTINSFLIAG